MMAMGARWQNKIEDYQKLVSRDVEAVVKELDIRIWITRCYLCVLAVFYCPLLHFKNY